MATVSFCPEPPQSLRSRVISAAAALFYNHGFLSVSVNDIAKAAGVTKTSLYRYFRSKDELAIACLEADLTAEQAMLVTLADQYAADPLAQIKAIVAEVADRMLEPEFRGWMPANFAIEIADPAHPIRQVCARSHAMLSAYFVAAAREAELERPEFLSNNLLLIMQGAASASQISGPQGPVAALREACEILLARHRPICAGAPA